MIARGVVMIVASPIGGLAWQLDRNSQRSLSKKNPATPVRPTKRRPTGQTLEARGTEGGPQPLRKPTKIRQGDILSMSAKYYSSPAPLGGIMSSPGGYRSLVDRYG